MTFSIESNVKKELFRLTWPWFIEIALLMLIGTIILVL
jgi:hypothetical protein